jgi:hypothetical protein
VTPRNVSEFISAKRDQMRVDAVELMLRPKKDPFENGSQTGKFAGAWELLNEIEQFIKPAKIDDDE